MKSISSPQHPVWSTIRFLVLCMAVSVVLWKNANSFDETEIKTILEIALMAGGYEGLMSYVANKKTKEVQTN